MIGEGEAILCYHSAFPRQAATLSHTVSFMSLFIFHTRQLCYSPVGNCEEANLVSRIPAPSIRASRMPPMAAEPTMATGPSAEEKAIFRDFMQTRGEFVSCGVGGS